jgi:hypothetical protein
MISRVDFRRHIEKDDFGTRGKDDSSTTSDNSVKTRSRASELPKRSQNHLAVQKMDAA